MQPIVKLLRKLDVIATRCNTNSYKHIKTNKKTKNGTRLPQTVFEYIAYLIFEQVI